MSRYSQALHGLALAIAPIEAASEKGTATSRLKAANLYAEVLASLGGLTGADTGAVRALLKLYADEDAHRADFPTAGPWLAACERFGFSTALNMVTAGGMVERHHERPGIRMPDGRLTLAPL